LKNPEIRLYLLIFQAPEKSGNWMLVLKSYEKVLHFVCWGAEKTKSPIS